MSMKSRARRNVRDASADGAASAARRSSFSASRRAPTLRTSRRPVMIARDPDDQSSSSPERFVARSTTIRTFRAITAATALSATSVHLTRATRSADPLRGTLRGWRSRCRVRCRSRARCRLDRGCAGRRRGWLRAAGRRGPRDPSSRDRAGGEETPRIAGVTLDHVALSWGGDRRLSAGVLDQPVDAGGQVQHPGDHEHGTESEEQCVLDGALPLLASKARSSS